MKHPKCANGRVVKAIDSSSIGQPRGFEPHFAHIFFFVFVIHFVRVQSKHPKVSKLIPATIGPIGHHATRATALDADRNRGGTPPDSTGRTALGHLLRLLRAESPEQSRTRARTLEAPALGLLLELLDRHALERLGPTQHVQAPLD